MEYDGIKERKAFLISIYKEDFHASYSESIREIPAF